VQIVAVAVEERVFLNVQDDEKIARWSAMQSRLALSGVTNAGLVLHTGWYLDLDHALVKHPALTFTLRTRVSNHRTRALAGGTCARDTEKTLLISDLPTSSARAARNGGLAGSEARPFTFVAGFMASNAHFRAGAKDCLIELQCEIFAEVCATLRAAAAAISGAKQITETKEISKDVAQVLEHARIESGCPSGSRPTDSVIAAAIVKDALVGIGKDGVGLSGLFEFFFCGGIVCITIRMKLQGQLAISALNFLIVSGAGDAQHFVKIAFSVGIQTLVSYRGCKSMFGIACHANHGGP